MSVTRFVAKIILLDKEDRFLMLTRSSSHPTLAQFPDLPGGMVEANEEPGQALRREIEEETGLSIDSMRVIYAVTKFLHGKSYPTLLYVGRVNSNSPDVSLSYEHGSYRWSQLDKLADIEPHLAPTYREALEYLREHNIFETEMSV